MELKGKKIHFLGDSITQGCGTTGPEKCFVSKIAEATGALCRNYGVSGTRIARQKSVTWDPYADRDFCLRAEQMSEDADIVVVFGGTNDYGHGDASFGIFEDRTPDSFCGALHYLYTTLQNRYPKANILVLTPLPRLDTNAPKTNIPEAVVLEDYVKQIRKTAEYYSLPVLDLFAMDPLPKEHLPDGLHPNDAGHEILTEKIIEALTML